MASERPSAPGTAGIAAVESVRTPPAAPETTSAPRCAQDWARRPHGARAAAAARSARGAAARTGGHTVLKFISTQSFTPEQLEKRKAEDLKAKYMNELDVKALKGLEEDVVEDDGVILVGNQKPEDHQVLTGKEQNRGV